MCRLNNYYKHKTNINQNQNFILKWIKINLIHHFWWKSVLGWGWLAFEREGMSRSQYSFRTLPERLKKIVKNVEIKCFLVYFDGQIWKSCLERPLFKKQNFCVNCDSLIRSQKIKIPTAPLGSLVLYFLRTLNYDLWI